MANNPFMRDTTILKESTYLGELKEQTKRNDSLTKRRVVEKKLEESEKDKKEDKGV